MKKRMVTGIIVCGIIAQFVVLASLIVQREVTLRRGTRVLFETAPVDPFDAFRGRYMRVSMNALSQYAVSNRMDKGKTVYARIQCDSNTVGSIAALTETKPSGDPVYVRMRVAWCYSETRPVTNGVLRSGAPRVTYRETGRYTVHLNALADRFYVPEKLASEVDSIPAGRTNQQAFACVRVYKGDAVLEDVQIGGRPLLDVAREAARKQVRHDKF